MTERSSLSNNPAARAEPRGIGSAGARDPLAREVKLLGALLGQVIIEQAGRPAFEQVERLRRATIAARQAPPADAHREQLRIAADLERLDLTNVESLIRAFGLYFQLTNLAEEKQRIRRLRQLARRSPKGVINESAGAAVDAFRAAGQGAALEELVRRLAIAPVLTAHPTEARRRTLLVALRRIYRLLDRLDDPRLTPAQDGEVRRRLREEISIMWQTAPIRDIAPRPLDEVRSAMALFDESLFVVTPRLYRALAETIGGDQPLAPFLHWGSWIGGDRDGNPHVTADTTRATISIQSEHVLRAYEAVCRRLAQTVTARAPSTAALTARLAADARELPDAARLIERRFPDEPFRRRFTYIAERLARTRAGTRGGFTSPAELDAQLAELSDALAAARLGRVVRGELADLRWQLATFAFHGLALEVRQHSEVHARTLAAEDDDAQVAPGVSAGEVLATFRAVADIQGRYGVEACRRYVVSFTHGAEDAIDVLRLARRACGDEAPVLDVVPLFESADALTACGEVLEDLLSDPTYRKHLTRRGNRQEVMLGYSDSTKESGALAAAWMLYRAEQTLVEVAHRHDVELVLFHGRGGAIGRGGGPMTRAILAQAPGSVDGRLKLTEQGEVIANRYSNPEIALRHLEQLTFATLMASLPDGRAESDPREPERSAVLDQLASVARAEYRRLVWDDPAFESYFVAATPIVELGGLAIGSRPAARGAAGRPGWAGLGTLRAIPWVFAWSQSRTNLPAWYGTGRALAAFRAADASGMRRLRQLYRTWPFFASVLDNTEMALAKADPAIAERYASLAGTGDARRIWQLIREEFERTVEHILAITERQRLLDDMPVLQRSIELRNPYVDSLSELQVMLLGRLRALPAADPLRPELLRLVHLTVSGVAAGLQNTG